MLKPRVVRAKCRTKEQLKDAITQEIAKIDNTTLRAIHNRTFKRLQLCIDHTEQQVYPFDR